MNDYNEDVYTVAKNYKYTIYILDSHAPTLYDLLNEESTTFHIDTTEKSVTTTSYTDLFYALTKCSGSTDEIFSITTKVLNQALEDIIATRLKPKYKDNNESLKKTVNELLKAVDCLDLINKLGVNQENTESLKFGKEMLTDYIYEQITDLLSDESITDLVTNETLGQIVFARFVELGVIENYEESYTYDKWKLSEITHV